MSQFLKQSTACTIMFGVFVDKTDGVTLETGAGIITSIDHATTGIFLSKNGAAAAIRHQNVTASVLDAYGMFKVTLDTTDTNTVGMLDVLMAEAATFLPVHKTFMVLPANVYDSLMGADLLDVNAAQWLGTAILAPGTAGTPDVNAKLIGATAQTGNDIGGDVNEILIDTTVIGALGAGLTALATQASVNVIAGQTDKIDDATDGLTAIKVEVEGLAGAAMRGTDNAATAASLITHDAKLDIVAAYVDTEVASILAAVDTEVGAIKTKTDQLTFTVANKVDATATVSVDTAAIADAVWDEDVDASHQTAGTAGKKLDDAGVKAVNL